MTTFTVKRVQHVSLSRPHGSEVAARDFYGNLLGLVEISPPESLRHLDLIWYRLGADELHLIGEDAPENTGSGRHLCIEVDDLAALRTRLDAAAVSTRDATPIPGRPRFFVVDPFGNGIEFTEIQAGAG